MNTDFSIAPARPQALVDRPPFHVWSTERAPDWAQFYRLKAGFLVRFPGLADFQISGDASVVQAFPAPATPEATIRHLYLNQVRLLVLGRLGKLIFHASAVEISEGAAVFAADSGRGKSTLAASFAVSGFRFLTDDGLELEENDETYAVIPSHPSLRLRKDSRQALIRPETEAAAPLTFTEKGRFLAGDGLSFCDGPRPLRRVYFLGDGGATTIRFEPMRAAEAAIEWVKRSFLLDIEDRAQLASHFEQVARLATRPIHYRLDYPRRYEDLPSLRDAICDHVLAGAR